MFEEKDFNKKGECVYENVLFECGDRIFKEKKALKRNFYFK